MEYPNFSVLISVYCKENPIWLKEAFDSVFEQTIQPSEIVLVKDGLLTSELENIIEEYSKRFSLFKIIRNKENLGLGLALQKGVLACSNEIIARMDTDDTMPKDRFEKQLKVINEGYDVVSCWSQIFTEDMQNTVAIKKRPEFHEDIVKLAKRRSPVCHAACFFRKSAVIKAGNYQHCRFYEDYHLWVRMIISGARFYNIQEPLYNVRTTMKQLQRRGGIKYLKNELIVFRQFYKMDFYSFKDLAVNSVIRTFVRILPRFIRASVFKRIWNYNRLQ